MAKYCLQLNNLDEATQHINKAMEIIRGGESDLRAEAFKLDRGDDKYRFLQTRADAWKDASRLLGTVIEIIQQSKDICDGEEFPFLSEAVLRLGRKS